MERGKGIRGSGAEGPRIAANEVAALRRSLLRWYDRHVRPLPWRRNRDPYRVWVAEVMLQQTRVAVVVPAYERFLEAFPTLPSLAAAAEEDVLAVWSGLGYYSRARCLHRAARLLFAAGRRTFPKSRDEARQLPGVGPYIAAAVLSIAYGGRHAAVDGNVIRVLSRLFRLPRPDARGEPHRTIAERLLPPRRPGDGNQALMELGETICTPRAPRCPDCPLHRRCAAYRHGEVSFFPPPAPRRRPERHPLQLTLIRDRHGRLLLERGVFPHLDHLWLPPLQVGRGVPTHRPNARISPRPAGDLANDNGIRPVGRFRHSILHRQFDVEVFVETVSPRTLDRRARQRTRGERRVLAPEELPRIGRSALLSKALNLLGHR